MWWKQSISIEPFPWENTSYNFLESFISTIQCKETKSAISFAIANNRSRPYNLTDDRAVKRKCDRFLPINMPNSNLSASQYNNPFLWKEYIEEDLSDHERILEYWFTQVKYRMAVRMLFEVFADIPTDISFAGFIEFLAIIQKSIYKDLYIPLPETKSWFL